MRLSRAATKDIADILRTGAEAFGEKQASAYVEELAALLRLLDRYPLMGIQRDRSGIVYRLHPFRAHKIYYRPRSTGIYVLRIVHAHQLTPPLPVGRSGSRGSKD